MKSYRILIVEDDAAVLNACCRILRQEGMVVSTAQNAEEALDLVRDEQFDVVLTDLKMPGQDGLALAGAIGKMRPGLPVLAMTGYMPEATAAQIERSVAGFISKPFTPDELISVIVKVLGENG